jgi:hypothetical protein
LLLKKTLPDSDRILTVRLWDSGVRLSPSDQVIYLGQLAEETLVQRIGLFSYWRAAPIQSSHIGSIREVMSEFDQKPAMRDLILIRNPVH